MNGDRPAESPPPAAEAPAPATSPEAEPPGPASASAAVELGAEQVSARNRSADGGDETRMQATVVDFRFTGYRRLLVQLDNGQVWRQIDGDRVNVQRGLRSEDSFGVEVWQSKLGGYRMLILPLGRTVRVERVE